MLYLFAYRIPPLRSQNSTIGQGISDKPDNVFFGGTHIPALSLLPTTFA